jgi:type I restriction enzyme, S subunit
MKKAALKDVAPAKAARVTFSPKDAVWQLNLDQVESQSGRILSKVTGLASAAGSSTQAFDTGNVLYSKLRPYLNKVVCPDSPGIATTELVPLRPDPKQLDRQYLTYYLRSPEFVTWISNEVAGAKMPRVTMKVFWDHEIPLPPLAEQKRIAAILDAADALRTKRREAIAQLDALLQSSFLTLFGDPVSNPMGWKAVCLRSVADLENGDRSSNYPSGPDVLDSGVLFLSTKNISDNQLVFNNCQFISEKKFKSLSRGKLRRNDLVITLRGTLGSCAIFDCEFETGFINAQILILHPSEQIVSTYLHALITTERMKRHFEELSTGVAVKQLTGKQIGDLSIPLPPLALQQKFAAIVESIERQKSAQRAHLAELDALFAALQHRAFRGEL